MLGPATTTLRFRCGEKRLPTPYLCPVSIREAARRVSRDVKAVHSDVTALLKAGILTKPADGGIEFPYEAVKVEFVLQAA